MKRFSLTLLTMAACNPSQTTTRIAPQDQGTASAATFSSGEGEPNAAVGTDGDHYFDQASALLYKRLASEWQSLGSLKGLQGEVGLTGPQGLAGGPGPVGLTGATGPQGAAGAVGPVGPMGPVGPQGAQGPIGLTGAVGAIGPAGAVGPMGPQGWQGPQGIAGVSSPYFFVEAIAGTPSEIKSQHDFKFAVPNYLLVAYGTGANFAATMSFNNEITCVYRSRSREKDPKPGSTDYETGKQYAFEKCIKFESVRDSDIDGNTEEYQRAEALDLREGYKIGQGSIIALNVHGSGSRLGPAIVEARLRLIE
jgi:hypothetical protein